MDESHTVDLHNVREGDSITATTSKGETVRLECEVYDKTHARDPDVVRTSKRWSFYTEDGTNYVATIVEGLKRFEWEAEYPRHKPLHSDEADGLGFIVDLQIHGKMEA